MIHIKAKSKTLGENFSIHRLIPDRQKRLVGPFCFLDHIGPTLLSTNSSMNVGAHPHIGIATLTYLFEGHALHKDSLGNEQTISPNDINLMVAGSGISHTEKAIHINSSQPFKYHGLQFWIALPDEQEDISPAFYHYTKKQIPFDQNENRLIKLLVGSGFGLKSPVQTFSDTLLAEITSFQLTHLEINFKDQEIAIFLINGQVKISDSNESHSLQPNELHVVFYLTQLEILPDSHIIIFGGATLNSPKKMWWNFVSHSQDKIEAAKKKWSNMSFPQVPGETHIIPLPIS